MIFLEIKRLYFDYRKDEDGNYQTILDATTEEEQPPNDFNLLDTRTKFLGKIAGSPQPYILIDIRKLKTQPKSEEEKQMIDEYRERVMMPPPPKFDTVEFSINVSKKQRLELRVPLSKFDYLKQDERDMFEIISLNEIGRIVQHELVMVENPNNRGQYTLYYKKDLAAYKELEVMMNPPKDSQGQLLEEDSKSGSDSGGIPVIEEENKDKPQYKNLLEEAIAKLSAKKLTQNKPVVSVDTSELEASSISTAGFVLAKSQVQSQKNLTGETESVGHNTFGP